MEPLVLGRATGRRLGAIGALVVALIALSTNAAHATGNHHVIWDPIDHLFRCDGSALNCDKT